MSIAACSTDAGIFTILAVDHRDSMRVLIDADDPMGVSADRLTATKLWLLRELGTAASAVMLDPEYSATQAVAGGALPAGVGMIVALEAQGYLLASEPVPARVLEGWSVRQSREIGADGIKFLVQYDPDTDLADAQDEIAAEVVADCRRHGIPLFLEPLVQCPPEERRRKVVASARRLGALGPDVLKVQFPVDTRFERDSAVWADACAELHAATPVPWALLSGGDPYEDFRDQVRIARSAGASGFMVGRALWREALATGDATEARRRFAELSALAAS